MPTPNTNSNPNSVPAPFHLGRALIAQGWNNNPGAQRAVGEFAVHGALSDIASRIVKKFDDGGKQIGTNLMSAGDVLNLLNNPAMTLPGTPMMPRKPEDLVVPRPKPAQDGEAAPTHTVAPSRSRATSMLKGFEILNKKNLKRLLDWALKYGFEIFKALPERQRVAVITGMGVHADSLVKKATL